MARRRQQQNPPPRRAAQRRATPAAQRRRTTPGPDTLPGGPGFETGYRQARGGNRGNGRGQGPPPGPGNRPGGTGAPGQRRRRRGGQRFQGTPSNRGWQNFEDVDDNHWVSLRDIPPELRNKLTPAARRLGPGPGGFSLTPGGKVVRANKRGNPGQGQADRKPVADPMALAGDDGVFSMKEWKKVPLSQRWGLMPPEEMWDKQIAGLGTLQNQYGFGPGTGGAPFSPELVRSMLEAGMNPADITRAYQSGMLTGGQSDGRYNVSSQQYFMDNPDQLGALKDWINANRPEGGYMRDKPMIAATGEEGALARQAQDLAFRELFPGLDSYTFGGAGMSQFTHPNGVTSMYDMSDPQDAAVMEAKMWLGGNVTGGVGAEGNPYNYMMPTSGNLGIYNALAEGQPYGDMNNLIPSAYPGSTLALSDYFNSGIVPEGAYDPWYDPEEFITQNVGGY